MKNTYQIIEPPKTLQKKVRKLSAREAKFDPVEKAEQAVARLSVNFVSWMDEEVERLLNIWQSSKASGFSPETRASLYRAAHDMRGQAATLGFPAVSQIAGVFCDILDAVGAEGVPDAFLEKYINAIRAIARETDADADNSTAQELANGLAHAGHELIDKVRLKREEDEAAV